MKKSKPLNLLNNKGLWPDKAAVVDAIREVFSQGQARKHLPIQDYGRYRDPEKWRDENDDLRPFHSVDWYVFDALDESRMQVNSDRILESFSTEPWRNEDMIGDHYDLFVMEEDMFDPCAESGEPGRQYAIGRSVRYSAAVISTYRIDHIWGMPYSYLKTEVMRQLCFMFGVPNIGRDDVEVVGNGVHCTNTCILRVAREAPDDWDRLTEDRIKEGAFCTHCRNDLRRFFLQVAGELS
jgi:predicted Zn-dependent protease